MPTAPPVPVPTPLSAARRQLLTVARQDVPAAMALAVPFVLCHPTQAPVLSELGDVAARTGSDADVEAFRAAVANLLATATATATATREVAR